jgi:hypothetical protein
MKEKYAFHIYMKGRKEEKKGGREGRKEGGKEDEERRDNGKVNSG